MRILHYIPHFIHGGAQRQLSYLAPELARRGHEVHVAFLKGGPNLARLKSLGILLYPLRHSNNYDPHILLQLIRLLRRIKPDLIQTWIMQADIVGGIAARLTGTPWLFREASSGRAYRPIWKNRLRIMMARGASAVLANSSSGRQYWGSLLPDQRLYVIPNGLPVNEIEQATPDWNFKLDLKPEQKIVLFVGRFDQGKYSGGVVHAKNLDNLVAALSQVVSEPGIVGVLCGDGPRRHLIKQLVQRLGMADRVLLPGFVSNVWSLMKQADVFVSVSLFEGNPNTVLEAMVCGCPLVVSDIPEHREFLDEESALLVNPCDPADIARAIKQTLSAPAEAQGRARRAQGKARQWTIGAMARRYEEVYLEVLDHHEPKRRKPGDNSQEVLS